MRRRRAPLLRHRFAFYRPREVDVRTPNGVVRLHRTGAEQWFFPDRWFPCCASSRRRSDRRYYVNFSLPLALLRDNYYRDLDLELDLWVDRTGPSANSTATSSRQRWRPSGFRRSGP
jgi:hypothetical protein